MLIKVYMIYLISIISLQECSGTLIRKKCAEDSPCTSIVDCPFMLELVRSGDIVKINQVRNNICGFIGRTSQVCCKGGCPVTPTPPPIAPAPLRSDLIPADCGRPVKLERILGGEVAAREAYPWMVAMGYEDIGVPGVKFICAGSLISDRYVLTAAHCLDKEALGTRRLKVLHIGDWDLKSDIDCEETNLGPSCSPPHIVAGVEEEILHPHFNLRAETSDDIALIRLNMSIPLTRNNIKTICLPPQGLDPESVSGDKNLTATGWGFTENFTQSDVLLRVMLPFNKNEACHDIYLCRFIDKQLCIGGQGGFDTCSGDSGGPLIIGGPKGPPFLQVGIVSYGTLPCGLSMIPAAYTSVSSYSNWILQNLKP